MWTRQQLEEIWANCLLRLLPSRAYESYHPQRQVSYRGETLIFNTPSGSSHWRVDHFFDAEPETLRWLTRLARGDVMYDVGANIGTYSIVAAKVHGARVFAFEPEGQNYATLYKNIAWNRCAEAITAYCIAIMDDLKIDNLNLAQFTTASAMHAFGESVRQPQARGSTELESFEPDFRQGSISFSIDDLIARGLPKPSFMKIDVDGFEPLVIEGAKNLLTTADRLSVLVEANPCVSAHRDMLAWIKLLGYRTDDWNGVGNSANFIFDRN